MSKVEEFENKIAEFFGAPYAVAVDSCTHGIELCLRAVNARYIKCARNTYLSVPMLANKLRIPLFWERTNTEWENYYEVYKNIYDAAVLWERNSYIPKTMMCISMQYKKHLSVGRLGVILLDDKDKAIKLKKMTYDGREPGVPWREQDIDTIGYHYYAQIELCELALKKLPRAIDTVPVKWTATKDWPDLTKMGVFINRHQRIYNQIVDRARLEERVRNKGVYYENHHVIPRCLGGEDHADNLILLTAKEHFICHKLLVEICPGNSRIRYGLWMMANVKSGNQNRTYIVSSREFARIKNDRSAASSELSSEMWKKEGHRDRASKSISAAQKMSYKNNSDRAKKLADSQRKSYQDNPDRARNLSVNRLGKDNYTWTGYVYAYDESGALRHKIETIKQAKKFFSTHIFEGKTMKSGKWKGYTFFVSKEELSITE